MTKGSVRLLAVGAVVALAAAACGGSSSGGGGSASTVPGVTANSILIGTHQPLTGPVSAGYDEIAPASEAYFKYINANGGINGRKITLKILDDSYDLLPSVPSTSTDVHQLIEQDKVFAIFEGLGTPPHQSVVNFINQQKVPDLFVASGCLCWNNPTQDPETFGWLPDYTREGKILGQYVKQHFAGKKIAIFAQDDDFGANGIKGFEDEIPASQLATVQKYVPALTPNIGPQIAALKASGADVVVSFSVPGYTAAVKLGTAQAGYNPQFVVSSVGSDPVTLSNIIAGATKGAVNGEQAIQGIITDAYLPPASETTNSWVQLFEKIYHQYMPSKTYPKFDGNIEYGMASAYTFAEAVAAAGPNLTRASLVAAVENQHFAGPNLVPYAYSSTDHSGMTGVQMGVIKGLSIQVQGTPLVTDDGSGPITEYTAAEATAPANGIPTD
jgi:ABC-type branched-subunit amino acid transport system substrate-binding protein